MDDLCKDDGQRDARLPRTFMDAVNYRELLVPNHGCAVSSSPRLAELSEFRGFVQTTRYNRLHLA